MARREPIRPEINVTPLVDVVLVLLIIFMVIMPQLEKGIAVDLPGLLNTEQQHSSKDDPITLSLTQGGTLYLEKAAIRRSELGTKLKQVRDAKPNQKIVLKADRLVRYEEVRQLFKLCQETGFPGIALQVGDRNAKGAAPAEQASAGDAPSAQKGS